VSHDLTVERLLDTTPEIAFDTFVDPTSQKELYAEAPDWLVESDCELCVGGRWTIAFGAPGGEPARETNVFEEVERPRRLVFSSTMKMPDGAEIHTRVSVTFELENGKTRVRIVQRGFPSPERRDAFEGGWGRILVRLNHKTKGDPKWPINPLPHWDA
jgi:uncharacterized protein YndB with AHSA1/START domain